MEARLPALTEKMLFAVLRGLKENITRSNSSRRNCLRICLPGDLQRRVPPIPLLLLSRNDLVTLAPGPKRNWAAPSGIGKK